MLECRLMESDDISSVLDVITKVFKGNESWDKSSLKAELVNHLAHCFIISYNKTICGFANIWIIAGEANLNSIAIDVNYRRLSLGSNLLSYILNYCSNNNCNEITLEVRESNKIAQNLYSKYNFKIEGERKKYYSNNGESALLMGNRDILSTLQKSFTD
ncbi:MAG: ribosomal protein S18-alanine N-acetyltransferase [Sarcina sp.]